MPFVRSLRRSDNGDDDTFPKAGVKFSFIVKEFLEECGGEEAIGDWTTAQVCEQVIKSRTRDSQSSYCELMKQRGHFAYGETPTAFISHAHSYKFLDVVNALEWHLRDEPDTIVWFDIFSINQHVANDWTFDWLSETFKSAIGQFGRVIMVLSPWNNPLPFKRAWCVFEAYCAAVTKSKFEIAMGKTEQEKFLADMKARPKESIDQMLATIRSERCQCSVQSDIVGIFSVIETTVGFQKLDSLVFERYRDWVIAVSMRSLHESTQQSERINLLRVIGLLYQGQGKFSIAESYLKQHYELSKNAYGEDSKVHIDSMNDLAEIYHQRSFFKARPLFLKCLEKRTSLLGEDHPDTLESLSNLAGLYGGIGFHQKARTMYGACLERQKVVLGEYHPSTLRTTKSLALHSKNSSPQTARALLEDCLGKQKVRLGEGHPDTLDTKFHLAELYHRYGASEKAGLLYQQCLDQQRVVHGNHHPMTFRTHQYQLFLGNSASGLWSKFQIFMGLLLFALAVWDMSIAPVILLVLLAWKAFGGFFWFSIGVLSAQFGPRCGAMLFILELILTPFVFDLGTGAILMWLGFPFAVWVFRVFS